MTNGECKIGRGTKRERTRRSKGERWTGTMVVSRLAKLNLRELITNNMGKIWWTRVEKALAGGRIFKWNGGAKPAICGKRPRGEADGVGRVFEFN